MTAPSMAADSRGAVWMAGNDVVGFLHRMTTAGLADLQVDGVRATLLLTEAGRTVDLLFVYATVDGCLLVTSTLAAASTVARRLREHVLYGDQIRVTDASDQVAVTAVWPAGHVAIDSALRVVPTDVSGTGTLVGAVTQSDAAAWRRLVWHGEELWRLAEPPIAGSGAELLVVPRTIAPKLDAALVGAGFSDADAPSLRVLRMLPAFGTELGVADAGNPHELGLAALVDAVKGCYVGQEVVARLETYDRVQRSLVQLTGLTDWRGGDLVTAPGAARRRPGRITTIARGPGAMALAFAARPVVLGDSLQVARADGTILGLADVMSVAGPVRRQAQVATDG